MAFQIRCPSCQKLYAAEERMVGKRIRCRNCNNVFVVEAPAPAGGPASAPLDEIEEPVHQLDPSNLTGTRQAVSVPAVPEKDPYEFTDLRPRLRPSLPQQFPGALIVEAWLPLALALVAAVWSVSETFGENASGKFWVALLRVGVAAGLFLLFIAPVTFATVKKNFNDLHRLLPPSPRLRIAATFAMPACFGYVFWTSFGSVASLLTGIILGLVFMAAVFWLVMRLDPQEAATAYAWACGAFLITAGVSAGIIVGANALLNQWMMTGHAESFRESPLGAGLAWTPPEPERKRIPKAGPADSSENLANQTPGPNPTTHPTSIDAFANEASSPTTRTAMPLAGAPETVPLEQVASSPKSREGASDIFVSPDKDAFAIKVEEAKLPWVKQVTSPSGQSVFESTIGPLAPSPFIGLVVFDSNALKLKLGSWNSGYHETMVPIDLYDIGSTQQAICNRYALSPDGKVCLKSTDLGLDVIPTGEVRRAQNSVGLRHPPQTLNVPLRASLLGVIRSETFVLRWSAPGQVQHVQGYSYVAKRMLSDALVPDWPAPLDAAAVSTNQTGPVWFATIAQPKGKKPKLKVYNLTAKDPTSSNKVGDFPGDITDISQFENAEIAFSADGTSVALLLEANNTGRVLSWSIGNRTLVSLASVKCEVPMQAELGGQRGRELQWLASPLVLVHGQTIIDTARHGIVGKLPVQGVTNEQVVDDNTFIVTYSGPGGHPHMDVVEVDTAALRKAPVSRE